MEFLEELEKTFREKDIEEYFVVFRDEEKPYRLWGEWDHMYEAFHALLEDDSFEHRIRIISMNYLEWLNENLEKVEFFDQSDMQRLADAMTRVLRTMIYKLTE
ncbi:MAG: hypothetical protein JSU72_08530 [Deltaproteobacteria bacterium]|nr:MAG: hypothetical protein JSU72_08530 [Deltaproteobacteria bacterium]